MGADRGAPRADGARARGADPRDRAAVRGAGAGPAAGGARRDGAGAARRAPACARRTRSVRAARRAAGRAIASPGPDIAAALALVHDGDARGRSPVPDRRLAADGRSGSSTSPTTRSFGAPPAVRGPGLRPPLVRLLGGRRPRLEGRAGCRGSTARRDRGARRRRSPANPFARDDDGPAFNPFAPAAARARRSTRSPTMTTSRSRTRSRPRRTAAPGVARRTRRAKLAPARPRPRRCSGRYAKVLLADDEAAAYAQFGPLSAYPRALPDPRALSAAARRAAARGHHLHRDDARGARPGPRGDARRGRLRRPRGRGFAAVEAYPEVGAQARRDERRPRRVLGAARVRARRARRALPGPPPGAGVRRGRPAASPASRPSRSSLAGVRLARPASTARREPSSADRRARRRPRPRSRRRLRRAGARRRRVVPERGASLVRRRDRPARSCRPTSTASPVERRSRTRSPRPRHDPRLRRRTSVGGVRRSRSTAADLASRRRRASAPGPVFDDGFFRDWRDSLRRGRLRAGGRRRRQRPGRPIGGRTVYIATLRRRAADLPRVRARATDVLVSVVRARRRGEFGELLMGGLRP